LNWREGARRSARVLLNAGRGNPNWIAVTPREAFALLLAFALEESLRESLPEARGARELGGLPGCAASRGGFAPISAPATQRPAPASRARLAPSDARTGIRCRRVRA